MMLLFYSHLPAASEPTRNPMDHFQVNNQPVILTDKEGQKAILILPSSEACDLFSVLKDVITIDGAIPDADNLTDEQKRNFHLPSNITQGFAIPISTPKLDLTVIEKYRNLLSTLFSELATTQQDEEAFFHKLEDFLQKGYIVREKNIAWSVRERVQFFILFQYLGLRFKDQVFSDIAKRIFAFNLTDWNFNELDALEEFQLGGVHIEVDHLNTLQSWINSRKSNPFSDKKINLLDLTITIKEKLDDEKLTILNDLLINKFTPGTVKVQITGDFSSVGLTAIEQMLISQNIKSLNFKESDLRETKADALVLDQIRLRFANSGTLENWINFKNLENFPKLVLSIHETLDNEKLGSLDPLLNKLKMGMATVDINYKFTEKNPKLEKILKEGKIRSLSIENKMKLPTLLGFLVKALENNETLTHLNLSETYITDTVKLSELLLTDKTIKSLDLSGNRDIRVNTLAQALTINTTLESLDLSTCNIDMGGITELTEGLTENKSLKSLILYGNQIQDISAQMLATILKNNTTLKLLNLGQNQITAAGAKDLADALKVNSTITFFDISNNPIKDAGVVELASALKTNKTLKSLEVRCVVTGFEGIKALAEALEDNKTLETLNLSRNLVGEGIADLALMLINNKTLKELTLWNCYIKEEGIVALISCLENNSTLTSLDISENTIRLTEVGVLKALEELLKVNKTLTKINLSNNGFPENIKTNLKIVSQGRVIFY